jgi:predicted metal-dependent enzyme (double-stranded beta helix superfamily)
MDIYLPPADIGKSSTVALPPQMHRIRMLEILTNIARLRSFVADFTRLVDGRQDGEVGLLSAGKSLLCELIRFDDWLPPAFASPDPSRYQQYLLHCDPLERFSVVSFVWDKRQTTPVHNHRVWGLIGVLRGAEISTRYTLADPTGSLLTGAVERFEAGEIDAVSPTLGDIHRVSNAHEDRVSVSIHVYGANIGAVRRATFGADRSPREFISGYSSDVVPNVWDRSA